MGSVTISADSIASLSVTLAAGTHSITAWYVGHANYLAATSTLVRPVVNPKLTPAVTGAASPNPVGAGQQVLIGAIISYSPGSPAPTETVTFRSYTTAIGTVPINVVDSSSITGCSGTQA